MFVSNIIQSLLKDLNEHDIKECVRLKTFARNMLNIYIR